MRCLWENKKTSEKSVFREAWSPKLTSQWFPVPCFWSSGFVPHRKWDLTLLAHQNTRKENRYRKNIFATLITTLGRCNRANKKVCHIHFKLLLWSKNSLLFFLQILKACLLDTSLAKSWALNFIQRLFSLSASLGFHGPPLTDWTSEGWIEDKMTSKTN